jgi:hypothetical protein
MVMDMDGTWMDVVVDLRARVAAAAGLALLTSACNSNELTCHEKGADCWSGTTTTGIETPWNLDASEDDDFGAYYDQSVAQIECVPLQDGECPDPDSDCFFETMESRFSTWNCDVCVAPYFVGVLAGPDPAVTDACCFTVEIATPECVDGRPLVFGGSARVPEVRARADWSVAIDPGALVGVAHREAEGRAWLAAARMEHASVAAFARVILQLCALGAPAELVEATQLALADEIRHARVCFAVASVLLDAPLGPGPIALDGADEKLDDVESVVLDLLAGGCLGETAAAARARIASTCAAAPLLSTILQRIADDESGHAALAFRTLHWLASSPMYAATTRVAIARFAATLGPRGKSHEMDPDAALGISGLSPAERSAITQRVAVDAVLPLLAAVESSALRSSRAA